MVATCKLFLYIFDELGFWYARPLPRLCLAGSLRHANNTVASPSLLFALFAIIATDLGQLDPK